MNIAFAGTPEFALPSLEALLHSRHVIRFIITSPDRPSGRGMKTAPPPVAVWGKAHGIEVIQAEKIRKKRHEDLFKGIDAGVVVASVFFIPCWLLQQPVHGFINLHPSLLPRHRGPSPAAYALLSGDR
ncbi:MAG: formyltransferase family protein, partial [Candidatus Wallbacteria bacterium]|nr:formyltransferase family protein [Candidatus Wallbacteria bacterium]